MWTNIILSTCVAREVPELAPELQALVKPWQAFCHDRRLRRASLYVDYTSLVHVGRWGARERKRPFVVRSATTLDVLASCKTLDGALASARRLIGEA
jgi:hypothetical protein